MHRHTGPPTTRRISEIGEGKTVVVLGGGIGGLTAAHELSMRGFHVKVYERWDHVGGKARSMRFRNSGVDGRHDLPGEHGFRFFPYFYRHIPDTMKRIAFGTNPRGVFDNLQWASEVGFAQAEPRAILSRLPVRFPRDRRDVRNILAFLANLTPLAWIPAIRKRLARPDETIQFGIGLGNAVYFCWRMLVFMTSCHARRLHQYEGVKWWDFIDADFVKRGGNAEANGRETAYRKFLADGLTRSLVACKAHEASTRTVASIMSQMMRDLLHWGRSLDRLLNGPTNDVWIDPWVEHLRASGVEFHPATPVSEVQFDLERRRVTGVTVGGEQDRRRVEADLYVMALPAEAAWSLLKPQAAELERVAPSLSRIGRLKVEWMNGIQFYLPEDDPLVAGHAIFLDSPWALTSISQRQFWHGAYRPTLYGDGKVRGILSVDISDWNAPGRYRANGRPAKECGRQEIADEVWDQLMAHLDSGDRRRLPGRKTPEWFLDPDIVTPGRQHPSDAPEVLHALRHPGGVDEFVGAVSAVRDQPVPVAPLPAPAAPEAGPAAGAGGRPAPFRPASASNAEPLLVNTVGSWANRPEARTEIENLFLASDYVRTHTDLATMEGADEAARRAVNALLVACGERPRSRFWDFVEDHPYLTFPVRIFTESKWTRHPTCRVWPLEEWWWMAPFRAVDRLVFRFSPARSEPWVPAALAMGVMALLTPLALLTLIVGMVWVWVRADVTRTA